MKCKQAHKMSIDRMPGFSQPGVLGWSRGADWQVRRNEPGEFEWRYCCSSSDVVVTAFETRDVTELWVSGTTTPDTYWNFHGPDRVTLFVAGKPIVEWLSDAAFQRGEHFRRMDGESPFFLPRDIFYPEEWDQ